MSTTSFTSVTSSFLHPTITPIADHTSRPTYATLRKAQTQLNANASSVPSYGGGGLHGHLTLTMPAPEYLLLTGVAFVAPVNPPILPVQQVGATAAQIAENLRIHKEAQASFKTYHDVDRALRNQLVAAVPISYTRAMHDPIIGFGTTTCKQLLVHLWDRYGRIKPAELNANTIRMKAQWTPPVPIEDLYTQLSDGRSFSHAGGDPITELTTVRWGYHNIESTGLFDVACREWRIRPPAEQTWINFQSHFLVASEDLNDTTGDAGYTSNTSNAVVSQEYANAAVHQPPPHPIATNNIPGWEYCWTHGLGRSPFHSSADCRRPADRHQVTATLANMKGGCRVIYEHNQRRTISST
jgi:hypothetical protein